VTEAFFEVGSWISLVVADPHPAEPCSARSPCGNPSGSRRIGTSVAPSPQVCSSFNGFEQPTPWQDSAARHLSQVVSGVSRIGGAALGDRDGKIFAGARQRKLGRRGADSGRGSYGDARQKKRAPQGPA